MTASQRGCAARGLLQPMARHEWVMKPLQRRELLGVDDALMVSLHGFEGQASDRLVQTVRVGDHRTIARI